MDIIEKMEDIKEPGLYWARWRVDGCDAQPKCIINVFNKFPFFRWEFIYNGGENNLMSPTLIGPFYKIEHPEL